MAMEAVLFSSFGLLMALMMKKQKPQFSIQKTYQLNMSPHEQQMQQQQQQTEEKDHERELNNIGGMNKKKKTKNKKKNKKGHTQQLMIYPKISYSEEMLERDWKKREELKKTKCKFIGKQIEAMFMYFMDDLQTKLQYNGISGTYSLKIPIPGATYSIVQIEIKFTEEYPYQLPEINVQTTNLVPLEKQKLVQIIKEHKLMFTKTQEQFQEQQQQQDKQKQKLPNIDMQSRISIKSQGVNHQNVSYMQFYYPYILNVCIAISLELFQRQDLSLQQNHNTKIQFAKITDDQLDKNALLTQNIKLKKVKQDIETNKQIYQNILQEIFNQHDDGDETINVNTVQKFHEGDGPKYPNSRGRYKIDYQELEMIGEGGFGRVYRCRNKIDSNIYAIKKMVINYNDPHSRKLLKQVALLSKLNHTNIVRYYQSWLEDTSSVDQLIADMSITDSQQIQQFNKIWKQYTDEHLTFQQRLINQPLEPDQSRSRDYPFKSQEDSVIFGEDIIFEADYSHDYNYRNQIQGMSKHVGILDEDSSSSQSSLSNENNNIKQRENAAIQPKSSQVLFPFKILYIVMEYCGSMTLKDFINKKFNEPNQIKIKLIRGILQGVSYIHSKRIIHRDLKPANIFLIDNSSKVKIGDFGLATIGNFEHNLYQAEIVEYSQKTQGVGTTFYRAPEQLHSSSYDGKIDIYSLGIIMFQIFYKFDTNMERYEVLNQVTRTHNLPKQFRKIQQNLQFEEQIQSCISFIPQQRPTVQKLLQTFRNRYFTQLVSLIANPKHFQFYQLINHLFVIKNQTNVLMKQNLYKNYQTEQFSRIYKIHRGVLFTPISLIPVVDYEIINGVKVPSTRKEKFLLLTERGVVMEYPANAYASWIRYAKETMKRNYKAEANFTYRQEYAPGSQEMRRFTFQKVTEFIGGDSKSEFSFKQKYVTAFDITYSTQKGIVPFYFCQMLKISTLMIETMNLTQKTPPIYLCHSLIYKCLAIQHNISLVSIHKFLLSISDEKFHLMKNPMKSDYLARFGLEGNIAKKIINLMEREEQNYGEFLKICSIEKIENQYHKLVNEQKQLTRIYEKIEEQMKLVNDCIEVFELESRIRWKLQIPSPNSCGMFWNVGPIKGFTSLQQYLPQQELCNIHLQTALNPNSQQTEADVSILSSGQFMKNNIYKVVLKCWQNNVTVKWNDKIQGEKDLSCKINIVFKKKHGKVYLMLRKNYLGTEKKMVENSQKDKDEKDVPITFPLQNFNYELLMNLVKQSHKKNLITH